MIRKYLIGMAGPVLALAYASGALAAFDATGFACDATGQGNFIHIDDVTANNIPGGTTSAIQCYGALEQAIFNPGPGGTITTNEGDLNFLAKWEVGQSEQSGGGLTGLIADLVNNTFSFNPFTFDSNWGVLFKQGACWAMWTFGPGTYDGGDYSVNFTSTGQQGGPVCTDQPDADVFSHLSIWGNGDTPRVPEPSTLALLGLGLVGFGLARRRKALS